jgi:choline-sulfatase
MPAAWKRQGGTRVKYWIPVAGSIALVVAAWALFSPTRPPRPNIILISNDTLRADRLGCYGCPAGTSPNIDSFCRESVQFLQAISQAPSTTASHMSLFTGLLPPIHRVTNWLVRDDLAKEHKLSKLSATIPTLAQYLKENGYRTIGLHHGGNVLAFFGFDQGFDFYSNKIINWYRFLRNQPAHEKLLSRMRESRNQKKPFFLFLHHYLCHDPYIHASKKIRERFLPNPEPGLPIELTDLPFKKKPKERIAKSKDAFWKAIHDDNPRHRRHVRALYDAGVNTADMVFGEIVDLIKKEGLYDRSLIAVISDHGEEFWEHGGTLHRNLFVEVLHVPLIIKFPKGEYGARKIDTPVSLFDLMPTILDFLRIKPRVPLQASSLLPLIRNENASHGRVYSFDDGLQFVRFNQSSFSYSNQSVRGLSGEWLYNRLTDPREKRNLAAANNARIIRLRALAAKIMQAQETFRTRIKAGSSASTKISEDLKTQLEALGYL